MMGARNTRGLWSSQPCGYSNQVIHWSPDVRCEGRRLPPAQSLNKGIAKASSGCCRCCTDPEAVAGVVICVYSCLPECCPHMGDQVYPREWDAIVEYEKRTWVRWTYGKVAQYRSHRAKNITCTPQVEVYPCSKRVSLRLFEVHHQHLRVFSGVDCNICHRQSASVGGLGGRAGELPGPHEPQKSQTACRP